MLGEIPGVAEGTHFINRRTLHDSGVHRGLQAGIGGGGESIVLSGGYVDDVDEGDLIIYTGHGGQDEKGNQVRDQSLTKGNLQLASHCNEGTPIRVVRGGTKEGYRYDGLFRIDNYWKERGKHGFLIYRYKLIKLEPIDSRSANNEDSESLSSDSTQADDTKPKRKGVYVVRIIRNSSKANRVKNLYQNVCQISGKVLDTPVGRYSEGCHIKPVGKPHEGPDSENNILCLSPDMHVLFDRGAISIANDYSLLGMEGNLTIKQGHEISLEYIQYHREHIFHNME